MQWVVPETISLVSGASDKLLRLLPPALGPIFLLALVAFLRHGPGESQDQTKQWTV
jgi:hypothetical protein